MTTAVTIGEFSRMTHLSVKTLRYYHRVGLLEPAAVRDHTGYRYYDVAQVPTAQVIRRFRDLDMPVDEVRAVLEAPDVAGRNALIAAHLDRLQTQLAQTETAVASLRSLLAPAHAPVTVAHRSVPATPAVAVTATVAAADLGPWWSGAFAELHAVLDAAGVRPAGPDAGVYAAALFEEEEGEATVYVPVPASVSLPDRGRVRSVVIPAAELAVAVHRGPHDDIDVTYGALGTYVAEHALGVDGPLREEYTVYRSATDDPARWRCEVGWPIFRTATA